MFGFSFFNVDMSSKFVDFVSPTYCSRYKFLCDGFLIVINETVHGHKIAAFVDLRTFT